MDFIITFFRDTLSGTLYIVISIISGILICSCIGYLAERSIIKKTEKRKYEQEHFNVDDTSIANSNVGVGEVDPNLVSDPSTEMETVQIANPVVDNETQQIIPEMVANSINPDNTE